MRLPRRGAGKPARGRLSPGLGPGSCQPQAARPPKERKAIGDNLDAPVMKAVDTHVQVSKERVGGHHGAGLTTDPGGGALKGPGPRPSSSRALPYEHEADPNGKGSRRGAGGGSHEKERGLKSTDSKEDTGRKGARLGQKLGTRGRREPARGRSCHRQRRRRHVSTPWSGPCRGSAGQMLLRGACVNCFFEGEAAGPALREAAAAARSLEAAGWASSLPGLPVWPRLICRAILTLQSQATCREVGKRHAASALNLHYREHGLMPALAPASRALLRSRSGAQAGALACSSPVRSGHDAFA